MCVCCCGCVASRPLTTLDSPTNPRVPRAQPPFEAEELDETQRRIACAGLKWPAELSISDGAKALCGALLAKDPEKRIDLKAVLSHKWLAEHPAKTA